MRRRLPLVTLLLGAAAAPGQELPFLEHARIDPHKVVKAEACGECHAAEYEVWKRTPHATGFRTLHRKEQALAIAGKLGFRLIKRDSFCFSCHYTPVVQGDRIRVDSGISCESCHGAGRDWINVHNSYGEGFDHRTEPAAHRSERIAASRRAGMRRPSDLYPVVANCFSCHTVPNERLVNVGGHTTGSSGFEFVEWSQGDIRHNFLASSLAGGAVNAERPLARKRVMYVVGRALDLEYSLRGVAVARTDGVYAKAMMRRVRSAVSELRAIDGGAEIPEVGEMLSAVRAVEVVPRNEEALLRAAERIGAATRSFVESADPERLAGLDDLVLGREPPEPADVVVAGVTSEPTAGEPSQDPPQGRPAPTGRPSGSDPGERASSAAARPAAGPIKQRLRPATSRRTMGPGACSGCHTRQNEWWITDPHYRSADPFFDRHPDRVRVATLYGLSPTEMTRGRNLCMDCHGTVVSGKQSRDVLDGVSCESCHGPAADWLEPHKDETDKQLGRQRPGHLAALGLGKADLRDPRVRAQACVSCHYITDPRLLSTGHPSGADFDYVRGTEDTRHWEHRLAAAELRAATGAVITARGPVPQVEQAVLAATGGAAGGVPGGRTASDRRRARGRGAEPPAVLTLRPPPVRPLASTPAFSAGTAGVLPELPEIPESASIEQILSLLQERLELLYDLVAPRTGDGR